MNDTFIRLLLILTAVSTVISGLVQMVAPGFVLGIIGADASAPSQHLFRTVGMFMLITGAMFLQALLSQSKESSIPLWIGVQKLAAAALVGWGVYAGLFGGLALGVAAFDLLTGILAFIFLARLSK
ncbi:MAG TPA: hypothetical protein VMS43_11560 [Allosphingosinicella sp.]|nr:hypothetical protein [Allosphingosinicella sp.]